MTDMYELVYEKDSLLREEIPLTTSFDDALSGISQRMIATMIEHGGIGLAGPQVHLGLRMFVMRYKSEIIACVNPEIIQSDDSIVAEEGCLSFPNLTLKVRRANKITGTYLTVEGESVTETFRGIEARCFQHELDHLNGVTFDKRVTKLVLNMAKRKRQKQRGN